ncbi:MAG: hypothetical protein HQK74_03075 [Desulfamplus sp.]|nr:hypothetical protein [Desulfamplus sp.]
MKIEIKFEIDKDSQELIQSTLNKVAENISNFVQLVEKFNLKSEDEKDADIKSESPPTSTPKKEQKAEKVPSPATKPKSSKTSKNRANSKKKRSATDHIFNLIKKSGGINVEDLKNTTGFNAKKIADVVYRLKKVGKIQKRDDGLYIAVG